MRIPWVILALLLLSACGQQRNASYESGPSPDVTSMDGAAESVSFKESDLSSAVSSVQGQSPVVRPDSTRRQRRIIKNATVEIEVDSYSAALAKVRAAANQHNAEISAEEENQYAGRIQNQVVLRVPVERFDDLIESLLEFAVFVERKSITTNEITSDFIDTEARLRTKRSVEGRFREILAQTRTIEEILRVENELRVIREEIESTQGRLNYLRDQSDYSTVTLTIYETTGQATAPGNTFFRRFGNALSDGWEGLEEVFIGAISIWPFWILLIPGLFFYRRFRKRRKPVPAE